MGILRKKKKDKDEEKEKKKLHVGIDWRLTTEEYFKLLLYGVVVLYAVAWTNFIIASLLYLMAMAGLLVFLFSFSGKDRVKGVKFVPFLIGLFFLIFSFSPKWGGYVMGAYLSTLFINVIGYFVLRPVFPKTFESEIEGVSL